MFVHSDRRRPRASLLVLDGRPDKRRKQRMRLEWLRLEFRMELAAQEPRMVRQLDHLDELGAAHGMLAGHDEPLLLEPGPERVGDLEAVPVTLGDLL